MSRIYDEEWLGQRLRILRPAPQGWVRAAQELPSARRSLDEIVARAEADLEAALQGEGYEPKPQILGELRRRFS